MGIYMNLSQLQAFTLKYDDYKADCDYDQMVFMVERERPSLEHHGWYVDDILKSLNTIIKLHNEL